MVSTSRFNIVGVITCGRRVHEKAVDINVAADAHDPSTRIVVLHTHFRDLASEMNATLTQARAGSIDFAEIEDLATRLYRAAIAVRSLATLGDDTGFALIVLDNLFNDLAADLGYCVEPWDASESTAPKRMAFHASAGGEAA